MVVEPTHALICFNDSKSPLQNKGRIFARTLADNLRGDNIEVYIKGYSESILPPHSYQWLIFVYEPEATQPPMRKVINDARDLVVRRRMRNVLAVTIEPNDLPFEWASIRKYDVSNTEIESEVLQNIRRDMRYVKIPYSQIQAPEPRNLPIPQRLLLHKKIIAISAVLLLLILSSTFAVSNYIGIGTKNAAATAAAIAITTHAQATQKAVSQQIATATAAPQARYDQFFKKQTNRLAISQFDHQQQWSIPTLSSIGTPTPEETLCDFGKHNTYSATVAMKNQYTPCLAQKTNFTDLALQVDMQITGDAGGVIFRSSNSGLQYYRISILQQTSQASTTASLTVYACNNDCQDIVGRGISLIADAALPPPIPVDPTKPITLSLIIQGNTFDIYINKQFVANVTDQSSIARSGQIGVYAASVSNPTKVVFSNLKVWSLPGKQTSQTTPTPTQNPSQTPNSPE